MSDYTRNYDGAALDAAEAAIAGIDFDAEFDLINTAVNSKADKVVPAAANNVALLNALGHLTDSGVDGTDLSTITGTESPVNKTFDSSSTFVDTVLNTSVSGTAIQDDDTMASASASKLASSESIKAYVDNKVDNKTVILDTPEELGSGLNTGIWTSSSGFASTTLSDANAIAAIIKFSAETNSNNTQNPITGHLRKAGTTLAVNNITRVARGSDALSSDSRIIYMDGESTVNLDGSSDFEYYLDENNHTINSSSLVLVGYII